MMLLKATEAQLQEVTALFDHLPQLLLTLEAKEDAAGAVWALLEK